MNVPLHKKTRAHPPRTKKALKYWNALESHAKRNRGHVPDEGIAFIFAHNIEYITNFSIFFKRNNLRWVFQTESNKELLQMLQTKLSTKEAKKVIFYLINTNNSHRNHPTEAKISWLWHMQVKHFLYLFQENFQEGSKL